VLPGRPERVRRSTSASTRRRRRSSLVRRAQHAERATTFRRFDDISTRILVNGIPATLLTWQTEVHFRVIALTVGVGRFIAIDALADDGRLDQLE
jgi:hypothetical protein